MKNPFKKLFKKKTDKTRQNLIVSIDDRLTGDHDVLSIKTTSTNNIILEINGQTNKISVGLNDLEEALQQAKEFQEARGTQPSITRAMGINQINALEHVENNALIQEKEIKEEFDLSN